MIDRPVVVLVVCAWLWVCGAVVSLVARHPAQAQTFATIAIATAVAAVAVKHPPRSHL